MTILEIKSLNKNFGGLMANYNIDFNIEKGEIVGVIGPNGAGKTTFFNCITGQLCPDRGTIKFEGYDITGWSPNKICKLGIARTFQIVKIFKEHTCLENVIIGALCRTYNISHARKEAEDILNLLGLYEKRNIKGKNLTISDMKRLEIGQALATSCRLLLLDEAMAGLNLKETQEAVEIIKRIYEQGISLLMVEHIMEVIMPLSHRVIVLNYGRKIAEGKPEEIVNNEEVIKAYLGERYSARSKRY